MNIGSTDGLIVQYCTFAADAPDRAISLTDNPATNFTIDYCSFGGTGAMNWFTIGEDGGCSGTNVLSNNSIAGLVSQLRLSSEDIHDITYYRNQFTNTADGILLRECDIGYTAGTYDDIVVDQNTFAGGATETYAFGTIMSATGWGFYIQDTWFEGGSYDGTQVVLSHNSFGKFTGARTNAMRTVSWDIQGGSPADLTANGNYWGNPSGPSHTDANIGAVAYGADVSTNVAFRPWMVVPYTGQNTSSHITIGTDGTLPYGEVGNAYSETFTATKGTSGPPYTWAKYTGAGETWPVGSPAFAMSTGGVLSGTPTTYKDSANPYRFGTWVNDGVQGTYAVFDLSVYAPTGFCIATTSLPAGTRGLPYSQTLEVSGGTGTNVWSVSGSLPTGLSLAAGTGVISGTPTATGTYEFTVKVVSGSQTDQQTLSIEILDGTKLVGADDTTGSNGATNKFRLTKFTAGESGTITRVWVKAGAAGLVKVAIYADYNGAPRARLSAANYSQSVQPGWSPLTIPATDVVSGTDYWLADIYNTKGAIQYHSGGTMKHKSANYASFTFPDPAGIGFLNYDGYELSAGWGAVRVMTPGKLVGADDITGSNGAKNMFRLTKFTASQPGTITEFRVKSGASGNVKVAIYADNAGSPGARLSYNNTGQAVTADQWNTLTIPATDVVAGTDYWLAAIENATGAAQWHSVGTMRYRAASYSGFAFPKTATGLGALSSYNGYQLLAGWTTDAGPPDAPTLLCPATTVTFKWSGPSRATKYHLEVSTSSTFAGTSVFDEEVGSVTSKEVTGLSLGTMYYWRVRAGNDAGWGAWSSTGSVVANEVP